MEMQKEEKIYRYFISYLYGEGLGKGNAELVLPKRIENLNEIREIAHEIEDRQGIRRVVIMNFIELGEK